MNWRWIINRLSHLLAIEACGMLPPLLVSLGYRDGETLTFVLSIAILAALALITRAVRPHKQEVFAKEGLALGGCGWFLMTALGALPYLLSPRFITYADAFFEAAAGFSTTGASVLYAAVDGEYGLSRGLLLWRGLTQWMGGLGFLVMIVAVVPSTQTGALHVLRAESTGPSVEKFVPKVRQHARILYIIYTALTVSLAGILIALGMPVFEAACYALGTISTGGFTVDNGLASYGSPAIETTVAIFMLLAGVNFAVYYLIAQRRWRDLARYEELRLYLGVVAVSTLFVGISVFRDVYATVGESARRAFFQVASIVTTTAYPIADYAKWPAFSQGMLLALMLVGGCAGSTTGAVKMIRWLLLFKAAKRETYRILHPRVRRSVTLNGRAVEDETLLGAMVFMILYFLTVLGLALVVSLDGKDVTTNLTAAIACVGNIGPGLGLVGPAGSYAGFSARSKMFLSVGMIVGRLEIYPVLILCSPAFWKRVNI
ncbi:potassium transporter KefA [Clostridia bacterium]|nr:potassium transporter KefA [Clostridia bacterium]